MLELIIQCFDLCLLLQYHYLQLLLFGQKQSILYFQTLNALLMDLFLILQRFVLRGKFIQLELLLTAHLLSLKQFLLQTLDFLDIPIVESRTASFASCWRL